jgi:hypothetical protein
MQHKDASAHRWAALIVTVLVALNIYWAFTAFTGSREVNPAFMVGGLAIQGIGVVGLLRKLPTAVQRHIPAGLLVFAILFGASMEWFGIFHGFAKGRVSPSVWATER